MHTIDTIVTIDTIDSIDSIDSIDDKEKEIEKEKEIDKEKERVCVIGEHTTHDIPSLNDVVSFCEQEGLTAIDPHKFFHYNNATGWVIGGKPIQDWHSAVRMWNEKDKANRFQSGKGEYGGAYGQIL